MLRRTALQVIRSQRNAKAYLSTSPTESIDSIGHYFRNLKKKPDSTHQISQYIDRLNEMVGSQSINQYSLTSIFLAVSNESISLNERLRLLKFLSNWLLNTQEVLRLQTFSVLMYHPKKLKSPDISTFYNTLVHKWLNQNIGSNIFDPEARPRDISSSISALPTIHNLLPKKTIHDLLASFISTIHQFQSPFSAQEIGMCLYGLKELNSDSSEVKELINALLPFIRICPTPFPGRYLAMSLGGLRNMNSKVPEVRQLLGALVPLVQSCQDLLSGQHVAMCLSGLKNFSSEEDEVCVLLRVLAPLVGSSKELLSCKEVAMALQGLKGLTSEVDEVRGLLRALVPLVGSSVGSMSSLGVAMSVSGLRGMQSTAGEVRLLLHALAPLIQTCQSPFTPIEVAMSLNGLKSLRSDGEEVRVLLRHLTRMINSNNQSKDDSSLPPLPAQSFAMCLAGLKSLNSNDEEVRGLLRRLVPFLRTCPEPLSPEITARCLSGLRYMNSDCEEVRELLKLLSPKIQSPITTNQGHLSGKTLAMCLMGLVGMDCQVEEVSQIVDKIVLFVGACQSPLPSPEVAMCVSGLTRMSSSLPAGHRLIQSLLPLIRSSSSLSSSSSSSFSSSSSSHHSFTNKHIVMCIQGMRGMVQRDDPLLLPLLEALWPLIQNPSEPISLATRNYAQNLFSDFSASSAQTRIVQELQNHFSVVGHVQFER